MTTYRSCSIAVLLLLATAVVGATHAAGSLRGALRPSQLLLQEKGFLRPRYSPKGEAIAAVRFDVQQRAVVLVRIDLGPKPTSTRVATDLDSETDIAWSRDGSRIAYLKNLDAKPTLKVVNGTSGVTEAQLTLPEGEYEGGLAWGSRFDEVLVAVGKRVCAFDLQAQTSSGCLDFRQINLLPGLGSFSSSADDRIAVAARRLDDDAGPSEQSIWVVSRDNDGHSALQVTHGSVDSEPEWSPNGTRLVFSRLDAQSPSAKSEVKDTAVHLWVVSAAGQNAKQVSTGQAQDRHATWSTSGDRIVFSRLNLPAVPDVCKGVLVIDAGEGFFGRLAEGLNEQASCLAHNLELTYVAVR